jgi:hypothetical protein
MANRLNRRRILQKTALAGFGIWVCRGSPAAEPAANEKLDIAVVGIGGRGRMNLDAVARQGENIVALCDVDERRAGDAFERYPRAKRYHDFRKMLDELDTQIDAVVVSTPDHTREWIMACKTGGPTSCSFDYGSALTEMVLLGNVAYRAGAKLEWDADSFMPKNCPSEAEGYINAPYRKGWTL